MLFLLYLTIIISVITDLYKGKIYNALCFAALILIPAIILFENGIYEFSVSLLNIFIVFLLFIIPFAFHLIGAGDVKLLMVVAASFSYPEIINIFLSIMIWGGVVACIARIFLPYIYIITHKWKARLFFLSMLKQKRIPYSIPIFLGVIFPFQIIL